MKVTDYRIMQADTRVGLVKLVKEGLAEGWEILGVPQREGESWWHAMVKKFDSHEGRVWVKEPGFPGRWEKVTLPVPE
jgi:hypothetical protein